MDPRIESYIATFTQHRRGFDSPVVNDTSKYQYCAGFGDVFRVMWRFFEPVKIKSVQTLLWAGSEATKESATVKT